MPFSKWHYWVNLFKKEHAQDGVKQLHETDFNHSQPQSPAKGQIFSYHDSVIGASGHDSEHMRLKSGCRLQIHCKRNWERHEEVSSECGCYSMNYTASCLNTMFDLTLTALSGGAAKSLWRDEYEWAGRGPCQWPKTHTDAHIKETHMYAHTEPQREIMHLLIMGVVRRDRERLMNAFMCSGEISEIHADFAKTFVF